MKIVVEVRGTPERLAELCHRVESKCPVGLTTPIDCPFKARPCREITPEDWAKLEVKNEDV